jgi:nicotinate-nucleotide pyrophosphorylase (carboxylating)
MNLTTPNPDLQKTVEENVAAALREDVGSGDITAALIPVESWSVARIITREDAVLCGAMWFDEVFRQVSEHITVAWYVQDGDDVVRNQELCRIQGPTRALLTGERPGLNFLQTLSGTATVVRDYVRVLEGTKTRLLDTRKTIPGLRNAQKYAVRCGGGCNHRIGLYDAVLIKENHIMGCGSITAAVQTSHRLNPGKPVEVEVESIAQLEQAIGAGATSVLLDNFTLEMMREAVAVNAGRLKLEASGGVDRETLRAIAETGVDYVSVGSLTKHLRAIDLSMRIIE